MIEKKIIYTKHINQIQLTLYTVRNFPPQQTKIWPKGQDTANFCVREISFMPTSNCLPTPSTGRHLVSLNLKKKLIVAAVPVIYFTNGQAWIMAFSPHYQFEDIYNVIKTFNVHWVGRNNAETRFQMRIWGQHGVQDVSRQTKTLELSSAVHPYTCLSELESACWGAGRGEVWPRSLLSRRL